MKKAELIKIIKEEINKIILENPELIDKEEVALQISTGKKQLLLKLKAGNVPKPEVLNIFKQIDDSVERKLKVDGTLTTDGIVQYIQTFAPKPKQEVPTASSNNPAPAEGYTQKRVPMSTGGKGYLGTFTKGGKSATAQRPHKSESLARRAAMAAWQQKYGKKQ